MGKFHASIILTSALPKAAIFLQYFIPNDKTDIGAEQVVDNSLKEQGIPLTKVYRDFAYILEFLYCALQSL